jgi:hypothetical protein
MLRRTSFVGAIISLVALAACAWPQEFRATLGGKVTGSQHTFPGTTFGVLPEGQQNFPRLVQLAMKLYF